MELRQVKYIFLSSYNVAYALHLPMIIFVLTNGFDQILTFLAINKIVHSVNGNKKSKPSLEKVWKHEVYF